MKKFLVLFLFCFLSGGCIFPKSGENAQIRPVETLIIKENNNAQVKEFFGYLKSSSITDLSFQIEGNLETNYVSVGQNVKKGQLLSELDSSLYKIQIQEAKYNLSNSIIKFENAKNYFSRIEKLHKAGGISDNDRDNAKTNMDSAKYQIEIAKEKLEYITKKGGYDKIYAPNDGIILKKFFSSGEYVNSGEPVIKFQELNDIEAIIFVSQNYVNNLSLNQSAKIFVEALNGKMFIGKIKEISPTSLESMSYQVKINLLEQNPAFKDGMSARAIFEIENGNENKIKIPITAILKENDKNIVFCVINAKNNVGEVVKKYVELGEIENNLIEIKSGLKIGEIVIIKGVGLVSEGQKVKIQ